MDIQKEFDERIDPIVLASHEVCKYKLICPFIDDGGQYYCRGSDSNRKTGFVCDIQKLKN